MPENFKLCVAKDGYGSPNAAGAGMHRSGLVNSPTIPCRDAGKEREQGRVSFNCVPHLDFEVFRQNPFVPESIRGSLSANNLDYSTLK